jgi:hypothetical protein
VILERAYKITMTFDVRGAAAGADHGVGRNRLAYSASVSSACGVDSRRSDSSDSVSNASRISLNSDAPTYAAEPTNSAFDRSTIPGRHTRSRDHRTWDRM